MAMRKTVSSRDRETWPTEPAALDRTSRGLKMFTMSWDMWELVWVSSILVRAAIHPAAIITSRDNI